MEDVAENINWLLEGSQPSLCMSECVYCFTFSTLGVNGVWLPILLVVRWTGKIQFSLSLPDSLVFLRFRLDRPVPHQPAHSPHPDWIWCLLTGLNSPFLLSDAVSTSSGMRHQASPEFIRSCNCSKDDVHYREFTGTGPVAFKVAQQTEASYSGDPVDKLRCSFPMSTTLVQWARAWRSLRSICSCYVLSTREIPTVLFVFRIYRAFEARN